MLIDHRHCLATSPARFRCVAMAEREDLMRVVDNGYMDADKTRGPWQDDFDARPACAGRSLVQRMEDRLDELIVALYAAPTESMKGEALGITQCIALVRTPYAPDLELVRTAAMARYTERMAALPSVGAPIT